MHFSLGIIIALLSSIIFGVSLVVNKVGLSGEISSLQYTSLSVLVAGLLSLPFVWKKRTVLLDASSETKKRSFIIGVLASGVGYLFLFFGQTQTSTINSAFISSLSAFFTIPFAWYFSKEVLAKKQWIGVFLTLVGLYILVVGVQALTPKVGDLLVLLFAITLGFTNAYSYKPAQEISGSLLAYVRLTIGALFLLPLSLITSPFTKLTNFWWILSGLLMWLFVTSLYVSIQKLGATKALMIVVLYPIFSVIASVLFLNETMNYQQLVGGSVLLLGVWSVMKLKVRN